MNDDTNQRARECLEVLDGFGFATQAEFELATFAGKQVVEAMIAFATSAREEALREAAEKLRGMASEMRGHGSSADFVAGVEMAASAIEAGTAEPAGLGAKPESAVSEAETPNIQRKLLMTNNLVERLRTLAMDLKKIGWQEDRGHVLEAIQALSTTPGRDDARARQGVHQRHLRDTGPGEPWAGAVGYRSDH